MIFALHKLHYVPSAIQIVGFGLLCLAGIMIHYCLMFLLASISFWTVRAQGVVWGYYNLFNIARMPDEAFRGMFRVVFTFVLPMMLVSNVPARVLADKLSSPKPVLLLLAMCAACLAVSEWGWRQSLKRYTSASS
jgi:ABC-2 type transport system permease protein